MIFYPSYAPLSKTEIALLVDETLHERAILREQAQRKAARVEWLRSHSGSWWGSYDDPARDLLDYTLVCERLSRLSDLRLALAMYGANRRAKCSQEPPWIGDWYGIKNLCAEEFYFRAHSGRFDGTLLEWGARDGVLYCDAGGSHEDFVRLQQAYNLLSAAET